MTSLYLLVSGQLTMERDCDGLESSNGSGGSGGSSVRHATNTGRLTAAERCVEVFRVGPGAIVGADSVDNLSPYPYVPPRTAAIPCLDYIRAHC
jgi:hypothetical protein